MTLRQEYLFSIAIFLSDHINKEIEKLELHLVSIVTLILLYLLMSHVEKYLDKYNNLNLLLKTCNDYFALIKKTVTMLYINFLIKESATFTVTNSDNPLVNIMLYPLTITLFMSFVNVYTQNIYE